ncbi:hypothetical protein HDV05_003618 [Chytridiales sp. JEL 0842]|nr:hypothetical protein HDV05_003618 [Chytridiales sp. JEL 0842]
MGERPKTTSSGKTSTPYKSTAGKKRPASAPLVSPSKPTSALKIRARSLSYRGLKPIPKNQHPVRHVPDLPPVEAAKKVKDILGSGYGPDPIFVLTQADEQEEKKAVVKWSKLDPIHSHFNVWACLASSAVGFPRIFDFRHQSGSMTILQVEMKRNILSVTQTVVQPSAVKVAQENHVENDTDKEPSSGDEKQVQESLIPKSEQEVLATEDHSNRSPKISTPFDMFPMSAHRAGLPSKVLQVVEFVDAPHAEPLPFVFGPKEVKRKSMK